MFGSLFSPAAASDEALGIAKDVGARVAETEGALALVLFWAAIALTLALVIVCVALYQRAVKAEERAHEKCARELDAKDAEIKATKDAAALQLADLQLAHAEEIASLQGQLADLSKKWSDLFATIGATLAGFRQDFQRTYDGNKANSDLIKDGYTENVKAWTATAGAVVGFADRVALICGDLIRAAAADIKAHGDRQWGSAKKSGTDQT